MEGIKEEDWGGVEVVWMEVQAEKHHQLKPSNNFGVSLTSRMLL